MLFKHEKLNRKKIIWVPTEAVVGVGTLTPRGRRTHEHCQLTQLTEPFQKQKLKAWSHSIVHATSPSTFMFIV